MLAILTTHPIQYQVPIWQALAEDGTVPFEVWYLTDHGTRPSADLEFGKVFAWDIDTLKGYPYRLLRVASGATPSAFWNCRLTEDLAARIQSSGVTAVWIQGWQVAAYWQAAAVARRAGVELWLRGESNTFAPVSWWKRIAKQILLGWLFRRVERFLCIGSANRRLYESFGVPSSRLYRAPYSVDNSRFANEAARLTADREEIRRAWGIRDGSICILFCGKFIAKKRPMDVVHATRLLLQKSPGRALHILFVGAGELGHDLRHACQVVFDADAKLPQVPDGEVAFEDARPVASFAGFLNQSEISRAYVAADCLILPSDHGETWGLVVNEAMASGLPCAISDACGCAPDLGAMPPNRVYPCGDTVALASILERWSDALPPRTTPESLPGIADTVRCVKELIADI